MPRTYTKQLSQNRITLLAELATEVKDRPVLNAIARVPREQFISEDLRLFAYENRPLPIGYGQTISQPLIVALMTAALELKGHERVLEIGTGSGYQAALLSLLAAEVITVERVQPMAQRAAQTLSDLGYANVKAYAAGEEIGWPPDAPYDGIIITAGAPEVPRQLLDQVAPGGRLVIPVGGRDMQELVRIVKTPEGALRHNLGPCRFVPLLGRGGWPEEAKS